MTTHPHLDTRLDHQHPEKLVFVVGDGEKADDFWSFLLVAEVVGVFWCFLFILGQMAIFGVGIFVDRWFFSLVWVFSLALAGSQ